MTPGDDVGAYHLASTTFALGILWSHKQQLFGKIQLVRPANLVWLYSGDWVVLALDLIRYYRVMGGWGL